MTKILHIALNTFRESVRDRVLYVIGFFAVLMMVAATGLGWVSVGDQLQIVLHFSLAVVSFFGALICVFIGTGLITKEIEKRTLYTILSKPVSRGHFLIGKFLGMIAVIFCIVAGMGLVACSFVWYAGGTVSALYLQALVLIFFELMVVAALAIFFGVLASPILAAIFTFCAYLVGQITPSLLDLITFKPLQDPQAAAGVDAITLWVSEQHGLMKPLGQFLYHVLPNLTHFQLRNHVVYGPPLHPGSYVLDGEFCQSILYAICYSSAVLLAAILCFARKRF